MIYHLNLNKLCMRNYLVLFLLVNSAVVFSQCEKYKKIIKDEFETDTMLVFKDDKDKMFDGKCENCNSVIDLYFSRKNGYFFINVDVIASSPFFVSENSQITFLFTDKTIVKLPVPLLYKAELKNGSHFCHILLVANREIINSLNDKKIDKIRVESNKEHLIAKTNKVDKIKEYLNCATDF